ncbi:MAG: hypothetical protein KF884_12525 [Fimbriimonadaceae bacterium]|nr:hypothetical protein [Fimbriimonadaceae bacterium]QYK58368.1 MAG: hypothetical protein KF884_12525 [Fimbriimonadaceae bacterium]
MRHFVHGPDGQIYGPADLATLQQWREQGRIVATTLLEVETGGTPFEAQRLPGLFGPLAVEEEFTDYPRREAAPIDPNRLAGIAWTLASVSIFFCPFGLGLIAILLAVRARQFGYSRGGLLLGYAVTCMVVGIVLSLVALRGLGLTKG